MKKYSRDYTEQTDSFTQEIDIDNARNFSLQFRTANGTVDPGDEFTGTCKLQISNDFDLWTDIATTEKTITGASYSFFFDNFTTNASHVRISVTITLGSADFELDWCIKD